MGKIHVPQPPQPPQPPKVTTDLKSFLQKCLVYNNKQNQILPATIKKNYYNSFRSGITIGNTIGKCKTKVIQTGLSTFRHNQAYPGIIKTYLGIFKTLCNAGISRTVVYLEPQHIQNQKHIQNPGRFATLVYSE